jgi:hypothetical protein
MAEVDERLQKYQDNMKALFNRKAKDREFLPDDLVLKWDARKEDSKNMVNLIISSTNRSKS